jgi:hypothetical protein
VSLQWQLNDMKPIPHENGGSVLPNVTEGAEEVIPVQHCSQAILPALVAGSRSRSHVEQLSRFNFDFARHLADRLAPTGDGFIVDHTARLMSVNRQSVRRVTMSRLLADLLREFDADRMLLLFSSGSGPWLHEFQHHGGSKPSVRGLASGPRLRPDHAEILAVRALLADSARSMHWPRAICRNRFGRDDVEAGRLVPLERLEERSTTARFVASSYPRRALGTEDRNAQW